MSLAERRARDLRIASELRRVLAKDALSHEKQRREQWVWAYRMQRNLELRAVTPRVPRG